MGGGRALLLQVAHPLVAAGVAAHSNFRDAPLQRLWRTLDLMLTITFADAARAIAAVRAIERVHAQVRGTLDTGVGPFPRGTRYDANDPTLLFWVHATLVDTALLVYERFMAPVSLEAKRKYYEESKVVARLFGIPKQLIPRRLSDFRNYMETMITGDTLAVGRESKEIAASILQPPLPMGLRQAFQVTNFFTVGLLPPIIRQRYNLSWAPMRETALRALLRISQRFSPVIPSIVRTLPRARHSV